MNPAQPLTMIDSFQACFQPFPPTPNLAAPGGQPFCQQVVEH